MKAFFRTLYKLFAFFLALGYLLSPAALIYAATPPPQCQITVNPSSIGIGGSVTVKWTSVNATAGAITNIGNVGPTGSINLLPSSAKITTYFGAFTGPGGTSNCQASVTVNSSSSGGTTAPTTVAGIPTADVTTVPTPSGQSSGLIPCGYGAYTANNGTGADGNPYGNSTGCQACNLAQLIQNIMTFAIGIAIPIAAALFAYAGFLYITSASDPGNIGKAKGIFKDALIGFLIAITAWLIINTLLTIIFNGNGSLFSNGSWFSISCSPPGARPVSGTITTVLSQLPIVAGNTGAIQPDGSGNVVSGSPGISGVDANGNPIVSGGTTDNGQGGTTCNSGFTYDADSGTCYNPNTDTIQYPSGTGVSAGGGNSFDNTLAALTQNCDLNGGSACDAADQFAASGKVNPAIQDVLQDDCVDNPGGASCLAGGTLGGGSTSGNRGVAQCSDGNDNCSVSQLQSQGLTAAQAAAMSCIAVTENAGNSVGNSGTGASGTFQITGTNWKQYAPAGCSAANFGGNLQAAQNNAQCNLQTAAIMVEAQGYQPWTGNNNGVYWNPNARTCVSNYDPSNLH